MSDRYRNPQVLISAHIETLVEINKKENMENLEVLWKRCNVISWERDVEAGKNMWNVLKTKAWA